MALDGTVTKVDAEDVGLGDHRVLDVQGPSSYDQAGGGESLLGNPLGLRVGKVNAAEGRALDPAAGYAKLDGGNGRLRFYTAADVEQGNTTDLSALTYRLTVKGR